VLAGISGTFYWKETTEIRKMTPIVKEQTKIVDANSPANPAEPSAKTTTTADNVKYVALKDQAEEINATNTIADSSPVPVADTEPIPPQEALQTAPSIPISLEVENKNFKLEVPEKSTAHDLLNLARNKGLMSFSGKNFPGLGFFLEEINGVRNDNANKMYWIYYINSKKATEGISAYILKKGDIISWKYEKEDI
jgi:hypothetical protein